VNAQNLKSFIFLYLFDRAITSFTLFLLIKNAEKLIRKHFILKCRSYTLQHYHSNNSKLCRITSN